MTEIMRFKLTDLHQLKLCEELIANRIIEGLGADLVSRGKRNSFLAIIEEGVKGNE